MGNHFNEEADTLAGEAARRAREAGAVVGGPSAIDPAVLDPVAGGADGAAAPARAAAAPDPVPAVAETAGEPETMTLF